MRSRSLVAVTATCVALAVAAPALADTGNNASDSTGVVQIGTVNANPAIDASTPFGGVTAAVPSGSTSNGSGTNTASHSTGAVQSSPFSTRPRAHLSAGKNAFAASAPAAVGAGNNNASSSTGAVQVGGGNSSSSSTGAAQVSGIEASPAATATPAGGDSSTVGLTTGVAGSGNNAGNSTGAVQVGGGNTSTGALGSAQSGTPTADSTLGLATPPGAANVLQLFSVESGPGSSGGSGGSGPSGTSAAGVASSPHVPGPVATAASPSHPVKTQAVNGKSLVQAQGTREQQAGVLGRAQALATRVVSGTLPFTGRNLAVSALVSLVLLGMGVALRRRGVVVH